MASSTIDKTAWSPQFNDGEYSLAGSNLVVDGSGNNIADTSNNQLATTDTSFTVIDKTVWSSNDGS